MPIRFEDALTIGRHLIDPRGRCDRRAMFYASLGLLAVTLLCTAVLGLAGADLGGLPFQAFNLVLTWAFVCSLIKRLHDLGRSGWWIIAAFAFWIVASFVIVAALSLAIGPTRFQAALLTQPLLYAALVIAMSLPPFGGLLWMQAAPGDTKVNRFGPVPSAFGFSDGFPKSRAASNGLVDSAAVA